MLVVDPWPTSRSAIDRVMAPVANDPMLTALDAPKEKLDLHEQNFVTKVREHGWFGTNVFAEDEEPGFSYSTGFWVGAGAAEVIVFSLKSEIAHAVMWGMYRDIKAGIDFATGRRLSNVFGEVEAVLMPVSKRHYRKYLGWSRWFYAGDEFPCVQLIWPDAHGVFPWELGHEERFGNSQPDLSESGWADAVQ